MGNVLGGMESRVECHDNDETHNNYYPLKVVVKNDVVREAIFELLSLHDLLTCSLVSKEWRNWCRTFIWIRRVCCVKIPSTHPCSSLKEFGDLVGKATVTTAGSRGTNSCHQLPFNGLKISFAKRHSGRKLKRKWCISWKELLQHASPLISALQIKYIFVRNEDATYKYVPSISCVGADFLWELIIRNAAILDDMDLSNFLSLFPTSKIEEFWEAGFFPRLRILEFENDARMKQQKLEDLLRRVLQALPRQTEIHSYDINSFSLDVIPRNKWHSICRLSLGPIFLKHSLSYRSLNHYDLSSLRLVSLRVMLFGTDNICPDYRVDLFWRTVHEILAFSCDTLQDLHIEIESLDPFTTLHMPFPRLSQLRKLAIHHDHWFWFCTEDPADAHPTSRNMQVKNLWSLNWKNFPALYRVEIWPINNDFTLGGFEREIEELLQTVNYTCSQPCLTVRQLLVQDARNNMLKVFGLIFPSVKRLEAENNATDYEQFWTTWPDLEELLLAENVHGKLRSREGCEAGYADYQFCGITKGEARLLQSMECEMLQNLHIVPTGPSITDLRYLRTITFGLSVYQEDMKLIQCLPWFVSRLSGHLAFSRMPLLRVTFVLRSDDNIPREQALLQLPCVEVKDGRPLEAEN